MSIRNVTEACCNSINNEQIIRERPKECCNTNQPCNKSRIIHFLSFSVIHLILFPVLLIYRSSTQLFLPVFIFHTPFLSFHLSLILFLLMYKPSLRIMLFSFSFCSFSPLSQSSSSAVICAAAFLFMIAGKTKQANSHLKKWFVACFVYSNNS